MASDNVKLLKDEIFKKVRLLVAHDNEKALREVLNTLRRICPFNGVYCSEIITPVAIPSGLISPVGLPMAAIKNITLKTVSPISLAQSLTVVNSVKSYGRSNGNVKTMSNFRNYGKSSMSKGKQ